MTADPFKNSREEASRVSEKQGIDVGTVVAVDYEGHRVAVREATETAGQSTDTSPSIASVAVPRKGDVAMPEEGDLVAMVRLMNRSPIVFGTWYSRYGEIPDTDGAERHISGRDGVFIDGPFVKAPRRSDDPSDAPDGSMWYRDDLDEYRGVENGTIVTFDTTTT